MRSVDEEGRPDNVLVLQLLEQADFTKCRRGHSLIVIIKSNSFQSHNFARLSVFPLEHRSIGALANLVQLFVLLHLFFLGVSCCQLFIEATSLGATAEGEVNCGTP